MQLSRRHVLASLGALALPFPAFALPTLDRPDPFRARPSGAHGGATVAALTCDLPDAERYAAVGDAMVDGNVPDFLRRLVPVPMPGSDGRAIIWVTPDYLAVGTDDDHVRVPVDYPTAARVAQASGCVLPTPAMVDAIWAAAPIRLVPDPMTPCDQMRSMAYVLEHEARVQQALGGPPDALVAGHKKDVVLSTRLWERRYRVAIYGWHQPDGAPIQPVSVWHGVGYADYSHGVRLVSRVAELDGRSVDLLDALANPEQAPFFSAEGPLSDVDALMHPLPGPAI